MSEANIPILIANFKPFRLVSRDESDLWEPSLDISRGNMNVTGYYRHSSTHTSNSDFHRAIGECDAGSLASIKLLDPEIITAEKLISAYDIGHQVLEKLPTLSPSLFIGAFTYFKNHQLREALAHAWIGIEQILGFIWKATIVEDAKAINIPKRRKFIESQQWNSAHKIEMLYQQALIDEVLYSSLSKARFARNDFIHKGLTPSYEEANSALMSLIILVEVSSKLNDVSFNRGNLEQHLLKQSSTCIPQTFVPQKKSNKPLDVQYWREIKVIPGDKNWEGDFESYTDITLSPLKKEAET